MGFRLRGVLPEDCDILYQWRIEPVTAKWSLSPTPGLKEHRKWFAERSQKEHFWIAEDDSRIGVVRIDDGAVSITINPTRRREGWGEKVLGTAVTKYDKKLEAHILEKNEPSLKIFERCGFSKSYGYPHRKGYVEVWER